MNDTLQIMITMICYMLAVIAIGFASHAGPTRALRITSSVGARWVRG